MDSDNDTGGTSGSNHNPQSNPPAELDRRQQASDGSCSANESLPQNERSTGTARGGRNPQQRSNARSAQRTYNSDESPPQQQQQQPSMMESSMDQLRRFTRNAAKVWTELFTKDEDDLEPRPSLVVNPQLHLRSRNRSHSIGSFHSFQTAGELSDAFADVLAGGGGENDAHENDVLAEPLLLDTTGGDFSSAVNNDECDTPPLVVPAIPMPSPPRRRTTSGAFLSVETRRWARELIRRAGNYLAYFILLTMLFVVPVVVYNGLSNRHVDSAAFRSAFVMATGTVVLSLRLVYLHLTHWYMPGVQKYVVRILWMVPIYAIQSSLSLRFHKSRIYIDTIRDYYEAYVIASFVYYLIELLGGEEALIQILLAKKNDERTCNLGKHTFPLIFILDEWELGEDFMLNCKHGVLQYVVFKSMSAFITFFCETFGVYGEGTFGWFVAYPYLCFFQNLSVMYALYCLVMLFSAVNEELRYPINWRPLGKFLCIKGVVFFTWWQGVVIYYLKAHGIIDRLGSWSSKDVANGLIDFCVVVEMVGFAIAHSFTFTYKEYLPSAIPVEFRTMRADSSCLEDGENPTLSLAAAPSSATLMSEETGLTNNKSSELGSDSNNKSNGLDAPSTPMGQRTTAYHPPATLDNPMDFRDAFWSSTVPKDTIREIQRLRVAGSIAEAALRPRMFSLPRVRSGSDTSVQEQLLREEQDQENRESECDNAAGSGDSLSVVEHDNEDNVEDATSNEEAKT